MEFSIIILIFLNTLKMYQGMTEKHINFDLSKTDNIASDVNQLNERNIMCKFCNTVIIWQGAAIKK